LENIGQERGVGRVVLLRGAVGGPPQDADVVGVGGRHASAAQRGLGARLPQVPPEEYLAGGEVAVACGDVQHPHGDGVVEGGQLLGQHLREDGFRVASELLRDDLPRGGRRKGLHSVLSPVTASPVSTPPLTTPSHPNKDGNAAFSIAFISSPLYLMIR
jgi:hypothetical protein